MLQNDTKRRNASTSVIKVSSMLANMIKLGTEVPARREHTDSAQHFWDAVVHNQPSMGA